MTPNQYLLVMMIGFFVVVISASVVMACNCNTNGDCAGSTCSQTYTDYCDGKKLFDYNSNGIFDNVLVQNSCSNTCKWDHACSACTPTCNPPTGQDKCVKGVCGAECDASNGCCAKLNGNSCSYSGSCNLNSCGCSYGKTDYCPAPGTVKDGICYYGSQTCGDSGCGLQKKSMDGFTVCDPTNGPKNNNCGTTSCSQTYNDYCDGKKVIDYNGNNVFDNLLVQNTCNNICSPSGYLQAVCNPDCSAPTTAEKCVKGVCGAECDGSNGCSPVIQGGYCKFSDSCNQNTCSCSYSQSQYCPQPGTVTSGVCYWGTEGCSESGCSLTQTPISEGQACSPNSGPVNNNTPDNIPPTAPTIQASVDGNTVTLTWSGASDNVGIDHYVIFRADNGVDFVPMSGELGAGVSTFVDSGLGFSQDYSYFIVVFDFAGNNAVSSTIRVTTGSNPNPNPQPSQVSGGVGGGGPPSVEIFCNQSWVCSDWSDCASNGVQVRTCQDKNNCDNNLGKPSEQQACTYVAPVACVENWSCTDWSDCVNGTKTRVCGDINNCKTTLNKPAESESCESAEGNPLSITGMLAAFMANPWLALLLTLLIIAIITTIWRLMVGKKKTKESKVQKDKEGQKGSV